VEADRVLWILDAAEGFTERDREIATALDPERLHVVWNKTDLNSEPVPNGVGEYSPIAVHYVSARTGAGLEALLQGVLEELGAAGDGRDREDVALGNERHARELTRAKDALDRAVSVLEGHHPVELGAADLHEALRALASITGEEAGPDLLDEIFRRFCIGK
jgi:tRNA modification GTPase